MASTNNPRLAVEITAMTDGLKKGLAEARAELKKFATEAGKSDYKTVLQQEKVAQAQARTEATQYRTEIAKLALEKKRGAQATQALSGSYREAQQRLTALGASIRSAQGGFTNTTPAIRAQITEYRKLNEQLKSFDKQMGLNYRNVGNYGSALAGAIPYLYNFTTVAGLASTAVMGLQKSFSTNLKLDALEYSIKQVSGTSENFTKNMEFLMESADRLGLDFVSTAEAFKLWQGAAKFSNLTAAESRDVFESVANAGAKMKLSNDNVRGAFLALSQMMSKGKVQAEELRGQLGERLPGAFSLAAQAMGVTEQELNKMLETGQVMAQDFLPKFAAQLDKTFGNDKTEKIESLQASVNRLSTEFDLLWRSEGMTNFFSKALDGFALMAKQINLMINSKDWQEFKAIAFGSVEEHQNYVDRRDLNAGQRFLKGTGFSKKDVSEQKTVISQITYQLNTAVKAYNEFYKTSASDGLSVNQAMKKYQQLADNVKMYSDALAQANLELSKSGALDKKTPLAVLGDDGKKKGGSSRTPQSVSDILNDLSGVGLNDYDAKIAKIRVEYEKLVKKISESTGSKADIAKALNLATAKKQFDELKVSVDRYTDALKKNSGISGKQSVGLSGALFMPGVGGLDAKNPFTKTTAKLTDEFTAQFKSTLRRGIADSLDGLFSNLSEWGNKTYEIEQKYNDLRRDASQEQINSLNEMERLENRINSGITNTLSKLGSTLANLGGNLLSSAISSGISSGNFKDLVNMFSGKNKAQGYGALAGLVGSTLSGIIKPSNLTGQTLSGALSGAGTGAALGSIIPGIGTAIGAVGGALVGALSSLFGSSARKKQEELAQKQVDLQQKMLAIQERQALLSYQATVSGVMTRNGVVSSVERDAYGDLVANIKGSDIELVLERTKSKR